MSKRVFVKKPPKRGRPPLGIKKKTEIIRIRVTKDELECLSVEAARKGLRIPELLMRPWRKEK
jgi:hypothetical protein